MGRKKAKEARKSLKGWAEGAREDILLPHIASYLDAAAKGPRSAADYLQLVHNEYHAKVHWTVADHEEPTRPLPPFDPLAPLESEDLLTDDEKKAKYAHISELNAVCVL
jgi:hypothetical protein